MKAFAPVVEETEPETLSYVVLKALDDEFQNVLCLWEKYANENALREVHAKSAGAAQLKDKISPILAGRSLGGYRDVSGVLREDSSLGII